MKLTTEFLASLEHILFAAGSATFVDDFDLIVARIDNLDEGKEVLIRLLDDLNKGIIRYEGV